MRSKLLIGTAALLASVALASAQNMPGGGGRESGAAQSGAAAQEHQSPQMRRGEHAQPGQAQERTMRRGQKETTGQAPQREQGAEKSKSQRSQRNREQTTGQGQSQSPRQMQREQTQGQAPQRQQGQQGQTGAAPQGQAQQGQTGGGNNVTLNSEQRTKIRQSVLAGGHAPRVNNVNFSLSVGTAVPSSVRVVAVPRVIWEIHPAWREYMYFVVGDQIVIVDHGHHIVAVLAV